MEKKVGGARAGSGRKPLKPGQKVISKSITLLPSEWDELAAADPNGVPTREAQRRLRATLKT